VQQGLANCSAANRDNNLTDLPGPAPACGALLHVPAPTVASDPSHSRRTGSFARSTRECRAPRKALFEQAIQLHQGSLDLYEEARTRLAFGASLRRDKSRVAARQHLRQALRQFERLEVRPWADLAASELDATGERARRSGEDHLAALTSQEVRIARLIGSGRTTKKAAAALFLSPKTVEYHLWHIYQKLNIRSRAELAETL
jgi:DNA-binding CsgD family transcriptional regulator